VQDVAHFISRFERCKVSRDEWTHEAHLVVGFWYVKELGAAAALPEVRRRIRLHNESAGTNNTDSSGYHETITRLYLHGIEQLIEAAPEQDFETSLARLLLSDLAKPTWPLTLYSSGRLFSTQARREWLEPDL
jgi:hypothetical protein